MSISIETCAAMHIGDRGEQQDRVGIFPHPTKPGCLLAVLSDGMGGHTGGSIAAEQVVLKARQNFSHFTPGVEDIQEFLKSVIDEAHVVIKLTRFTSEADPHSTACVFVLRPGHADWAHCGDSRIYHFRRGGLVSRSPDHSLVGELVRSGRITEAQAETHPQRNLLLSCLGAEREPRIDFGATPALQAGDVFLLCSDGLWAYFSDYELGTTLDELDPRAAAKVLINAARERGAGAGDNISVAIVKVVPVVSAGNALG
ncbi:PP2C family protein-serine/threonine phosphatase [Uliginosibacterium sp. H1]|uniref:PP2C family protein-serine/threonine phosphatase n=1 Tax=Uliginosibacterium sp. H1 TaxID=3114757 RepID=UPI002E16FD04|nr:protein phosphatase 2C domain-containing protein [Uliginosibacterium sp. H1]